MQPSLGDEILKRGWGAGAVCGHDLVQSATPHLAHCGMPPVQVHQDDWLVIVSQTCDVVAHKIEAEPFVEALHCKPIQKLRPEYKELRSTRFLDFKPNRDTHPNVILSAHANTDRYLIPREILCGHVPDSGRSLGQIATMRVLSWYSLRYARPAWPNAFFKRIGKTKKLLKSALEPLKDDIAEVRISFNEDERYRELNEQEIYHIAIFFVVDAVVWGNNVNGRIAIHKAFTDFVTVIKGCRGVEVNEDLSDVFSGDDFSWQSTRSSDEWNFANLTHRE